MGKTKSIINADLVKYLANLANIVISDDENKQFQNSLSGMLNTMNDVSNINIESAPTEFKTTDEINVFRDDIVTPSFTQEEALQNTKQSHNGYFLVPRILK